MKTVASIVSAGITARCSCAASVSRISLARQISTSAPITSRKVKVTYPWYIGERLGYTPQNLTKENKEFIEEVTEDIYGSSHVKKFSPLVEEPWERCEYNPASSMRTGVIARKIGVIPQWDKEGKKIFVTLMQVADNHVIKYIDVETFARTSMRGRKFGAGKFGALVVGADSQDPQYYTAGYRGLFEASGVMPKRKLATFLVTPDARIQPGTRLRATHFNVGQYVDAYGRTQGHGFQGVMKRWGFKGGTSDKLGNTKTHRRPGAIGTSGDAMVKPGKKLPGRMGFEFRFSRGLKIWRMNTKYDILYLHGTGVPGPVHRYVFLRDTVFAYKRDKNPPFPTSYPEELEEPLPEELFAEGLFQMTSPTIEFEEGEDESFVPKIQVRKQAKAKR